MNKILSLTLVSSFITGLLCSCHINKISGNGKIVNQEISIGNYNKLLIKGENINLFYVQSDDAPYLKIETDQNIMDILIIRSDGNKLDIRPKHKHIEIRPSRLVVTTNSTALKEFKMAGGGDCNLGKGLTGDKLEIKLAGGGTIKADSVTVKRLDCAIAGSGMVYLSGKTDILNVKSAGSSRVKAFDLQTDKFYCKTAGSTSIEITANKEISTNIVGSGTIRYKGNPSIKEKSIIGSGSIIAVD